MGYLLRRLLKLRISMINKSLCLSQSIPSIFVSLAFVPKKILRKIQFSSIHGSLVSNIVLLECHLRNLNPPCLNKLIDLILIS